MIPTFLVFVSISLVRCIRMANSRAQSLVALLQRVLDGLKRQQEVTLAASHARSCELENALESCRQAPLVLSSISFLPDEINTPQAFDYEEGEVVGDDWLSSGEDDNMDVVSSSEEGDNVSANDEQPPVKQPSTHLDLYGVIEVSSRLTENNPSQAGYQNWNDLDDSFRLPGLTVPEVTYPGFAFPAEKLQRPNSAKSSSRKQKIQRALKTRRQGTRGPTRPTDEEKYTTVVKLD